MIIYDIVKVNCNPCCCNWSRTMSITTKQLLGTNRILWEKQQKIIASRRKKKWKRQKIINWVDGPLCSVCNEVTSNCLGEELFETAGMCDRQIAIVFSFCPNDIGFGAYKRIVSHTTYNQTAERLVLVELKGAKFTDTPHIQFIYIGCKFNTRRIFTFDLCGAEVSEVDIGYKILPLLHPAGAYLLENATKKKKNTIHIIIWYGLSI